jgi:Holliday junction resolvase
MHRYAKGYRAERSLVHELSKKGYMVVRTPRSGRINLASPDVIAAKNGVLIVIECKSHEEAFKVPAEQLGQLKEWETRAGAKAYIGWKISYKGWFFLSLADVTNNNGNIGKKFVDEKALSIEEI